MQCDSNIFNDEPLRIAKTRGEEPTNKNGAPNPTHEYRCRQRMKREKKNVEFVCYMRMKRSTNAFNSQTMNWIECFLNQKHNDKANY